MEHTKGSWTRETGQRFRHDNSAGIKGPDGIYVATALDFNSYDRDEEVEANARLIAAAPDLLAALKSIVQAATPMLGAVEYDGMFEVHGRFIKEALTTIKKAGG